MLTRLWWVMMAAVASVTFSSKQLLRQRVKDAVRAIDSGALADQSRRVLERVTTLTAFQSASAISIFISMPTGEIDTTGLIAAAFAHGKRVFIPKVTGKASQDMIMVEVYSVEEIESFPKSKWQIPEPTMDFIAGRYDKDLLAKGIIDLVVVPGVVFDASCGRVGHGKGYYDCFLDRLASSSSAIPSPSSSPSSSSKISCPRTGGIDSSPACISRRLTTIGLALEEQMMVDGTIEMEPHDKYLDYVITPSQVIAKAGDS
jgi:5-formyltetrahydrofolate cyclo-ligase